MGVGEELRMSMNSMLPLALLVGVLGSLVVWAVSELKAGQPKNLILGLICLSICCAATFFITQLTYKVQAAYERTISASVIVKLSEHVEPSKRSLITSVVREFEKEAEGAQGYLPGVIKLKNRLERVGKNGDPSP